MDPDPSSGLLGLLFCLLIVAFASATEAALTAITRHRVHALLSEGEQRAKALMELFDNPNRLRGTILILTTGATIAATALALDLAQDLQLSSGQQLAMLLALLLIWLVIGIALPKQLATTNPDRVALRLVQPLRLAMLICAPLLWLLRFILKPVSGGSSSPLVSEEELRLLVNVGEEDGLIEAEEREMIKGIFDFSATLVREIMVPRIDIVALPVDATVSEVIDTFLKHRHSRVPIYDESIDQIVGVLNIKDVLTLLRDNRGNESITALTRTPFFVPETMKVDDLLRTMQQKRVRMAIIVDEYGGTAGLATIEDLVEEIVGEIQDEYDIEEPAIEEVALGEWRFDGRISIYEVNDRTGLQLQSEEVDSLGGYISERLGSIPRLGDLVEVPGARIIVESVKGLRPYQLRILLEQPEPQAAGQEAAPEREPG